MKNAVRQNTIAQNQGGRIQAVQRGAKRATPKASTIGKSGTAQWQVWTWDHANGVWIADWLRYHA